MASKKQFYAVKKGRAPGIYQTWDECKTQVDGFNGAVYKGFHSRAEAKKFLEQPESYQTHRESEIPKRDEKIQVTGSGRVTIYTDGSSVRNPGRGGYAAVMLFEGQRKEVSGGFRLTTNNRMEMMAALTGLSLLKRPCAVTIYTDSKYLHDAISNGWIKRWLKNGWRTREDTPVANQDLWLPLWEQVQKHDVKFEWVRGHAGNVENERCDELATSMSARDDLPPDAGYENGLMGKPGEWD